MQKAAMSCVGYCNQVSCGEVLAGIWDLPGNITDLYVWVTQ